MFLDDWQSLGRVVLVGALAYGAVVVALRSSGKRTLSKMNAFDMIVTIALGSALATTMLSKETTLIEGVLGLAVLIVMQLGVTWLSVRSESFQSLIKAKPTFLVYQGKWVREAMRRERVSEEEILAALRASGSQALGEQCHVVLETDGTLSVISSGSDVSGISSLANVQLPSS